MLAGLRMICHLHFSRCEVVSARYTKYIVEHTLTVEADSYILQEEKGRYRLMGLTW